MKKEYLNEIIRKSLNGQKQAFKEIMEEYTDYVFVLAFRILNNEDDSKDIVQETFIRIWKNLAKYNSKIKFTTWIYKIALNLSLDKLRTDKRKSEISNSNPDVLKRILSDDDPEKVFGKKETQEILIKLSENLSLKQKAVFILRDIQELNPEETTVITGMSKEQIKSNLYNARKEIKEQLIKIGYEL